jgi:hypothetical protein
LAAVARVGVLVDQGSQATIEPIMAAAVGAAQARRSLRFRLRRHQAMFFELRSEMAAVARPLAAQWARLGSPAATE